MTEYDNLQNRFAAALGNSAHTDQASNLFAGDPESVVSRLGVYRGNVRSNAHKALRNTYPVIEKIVGEEFFEGLAREYQRTRPSTSGDLNEYGDSLSEFLQQFLPARELPYLPEVARLEWTIHLAHYAADAPELDVVALAAVPAADFGRLKLHLNPASHALESPFPLARIWEIHQPNYAGAFEVDLESGTTYTLVNRPQYRVEACAIDIGGYAFITALRDDASLAEALEIAYVHKPEFDLGSALQDAVARRLIVAFELR